MSKSETSTYYDYGRGVEMNSLAAAAYESGSTLQDRVSDMGWNLLQTADNDGAFGFAAEKTAGGRKTLVLSFRGTDSVGDLLDYDIHTTEPFRAHTDKVAALMDYAVANADQYDEIVVTGHSLGGAMAQWALSDLRAGLGDQADKVSGYTIGSPGLGAADLFGNVGSYEDRMFQFEDASGWLGDAVTVYPGQTGTEIEWSFDDGLMNYYSRVLGYMPGVLSGNELTEILEQHASQVYVENGIRGLLQDDTVAGVDLGLHNGASGGNDLVRASDGGAVLSGGAGNDVLAIDADTTVADSEGANSVVYTAPGWDATVQSAGLSTLYFQVGIGLGDISYSFAGNDLLFDLDLTTGSADDGSITLTDWSASADRQPAQACFVQASADGFLEQMFVDLGGLGGSNGTLAELGSLDDNGHILNAGGTTNDMLAGASGADRLYGHAGNDILYGGKNTDWLDGGAGDDLLIGEDGVDYLSGGAGADRFVLTETDHVEVIRDFSKADGDRIELGGLLDSGDVGGGNLDDYVWAYQDGADSIIAVDRNGKAGWWDVGHATGLSFTEVARLENTGFSNNDLDDIISVSASGSTVQQLVSAMASHGAGGVTAAADYANRTIDDATFTQLTAAV